MTRGKHQKGKASVEEMLRKAEQPSKVALKLHAFYKGKIEVVPKCPVKSHDDFAIWYTPGVAEPCKKIHENKDAVFDYTNKGNSVAIVSDGSRVLGLGDLGAEAGLPVMEGKALLYKFLGGVDAYPIMLDTKSKEKIIDTCKIIAPSFGGINLEDIEKPKCFEIMDRLKNELDIPVWHDDQQGTASVVTAALVNAISYVGKKLDQVDITLVGSGAANIATARLLRIAGARPKRMIIVDSKGILNAHRDDIKAEGGIKWELCLKTNVDDKDGGIEEALQGADVCIAASKSGPGVIKKEWVKKMAKDAIVFACANPIPEIWPWEAKEAGAKIVATGRSDFSNQVNNSLGFPGIFRGTLDVRARTITDEMCIAAALELAKIAREKGLSEEKILPSMDDWDVFPREAVAVARKAIEQGVARVKKSSDELYEHAESVIRRSREMSKAMLSSGYIQAPPQ